MPCPGVLRFCLAHKLPGYLAVPNHAASILGTISLQVGECVGTYWRPNFDANLYPYLPPHITKPKEVIRLYIIPLPERCYFAVGQLLCCRHYAPSTA